MGIIKCDRIFRLEVNLYDRRFMKCGELVLRGQNTTASNEHVQTKTSPASSTQF